MEKRNQMLMKAAVAGLMGAAVIAAPGFARAKTAAKNVKCYGVNKCASHGQCGGPGHQCAGKNSCKGQGWLLMPQDSCLAIEGGSLAPVAPKMQEKGQ